MVIILCGTVTEVSQALRLVVLLQNPRYRPPTGYDCPKGEHPQNQESGPRGELPRRCMGNDWLGILQHESERARDSK